MTSRLCSLAPYLAALAAVLSVQSAFGDGKAFRIGDVSGLAPLQQNEQLAAINLHNGTQRMLIAINVDLADDESGLWIFPVPGDPNAVHVDLVDRFPSFRGLDPRELANAGLDALIRTVRITQIYPALAYLPSLGGRYLGAGAPHMQIEKWGLRAAVVEAATADELLDFLQQGQPGAKLEDLAGFEPYFDGGHAFVVTWLASKTDFLAEFPDYEKRREFEHVQGRWPTLLVQFPTAEAFYPMRPTASYGDAEFSVRIYVMGYSELVTSPAMERIVDVKYFEQGRLDDDLPVEFLEGTPREAIPYTLVRMDTLARNFVDDLCFRPSLPEWLQYAQFVRSVTKPPMAALSWLVVTLVLSFISAGLAGVLVFRRWSQPALLGLFNCLTFLALLLVLLRTDVSSRWHPANGGSKGHRRGMFAVAFTVFFITGTVVIDILLRLPLRG